MSLVVLAVWFTPTTANAVDPSMHITQYAHSSWRLQDGFLSGAPTAIAQTTDGYIWVGTESGLFRFDGLSFMPWSTFARQKELSTAQVPPSLAAVMGAFGSAQATGSIAE